MTLLDTFSSEILSWYERYGRSFPWRTDDSSQYRTLIAEILLWKTRAETIAEFYDAFFDKYPNPESLRESTISEVMKLIQFLGLQNRRARMIKRMAENNLDEVIIDEKEFRKRFGVGQYIARATLAIHHGVKIVPVDENIKRLLLKIFDFEIKNVRSISKNEDMFLAQLIKSDHRKAIWAMIDYSSLVCTRNNPACHECIFNERCKHHSK